MHHHYLHTHCTLCKALQDAWWRRSKSIHIHAGCKGLQDLHLHPAWMCMDMRHHLSWNALYRAQCVSRGVHVYAGRTCMPRGNDDALAFNLLDWRCPFPLPTWFTPVVWLSSARWLYINTLFRDGRFSISNIINTYKHLALTIHIMCLMTKGRFLYSDIALLFSSDKQIIK